MRSTIIVLTVLGSASAAATLRDGHIKRVTNSTTEPNDQLESLSFDAGVPRLTEADFAFIEKLNPDESMPTSSSTTSKRDETSSSLGNTDEDSWAKWEAWEMDTWFEKFVHTVSVPSKDGGESYLLANSTNFLADFFRSVGDGQTEPNPCATIISDCTFQHSDDRTLAPWRDGIIKENIKRARFARKAIILWRNNIQQGYTIFSQAQFDTTLDITAIRNNFVAVEQTKPASPLAVVLPLMSLLGAFVPGVGPAAAVIGSIVGVPSGGKRWLEEGEYEEEEESLLRRQTGVEVYDYRSGDSSMIQQERSKAMNNIQALQSIVNPDTPGSLGAQVKEMQDKAARGKLFDKVGKVINSCVGLYKGIQAMNPKLQIEEVSDWPSFDARTMELLGSFRNNIANSYAVNTKTWYPAKVSIPGGSKDTITSAGMKTLLAGGQPYKDAPDGSFNVVASTQTLQDFFRKAVLMEVLKSQSVYLWRQHFRTKEDCLSWQNTHYRKQQLTDSNTDWCEQVNGEWQIRIARLPFKREESLGSRLPKSKRMLRGPVIPAGYPRREESYNAMKIGAPSASSNNQGSSYVQVLSLQQNSAFFDKWRNANLAKARIGSSAGSDWLTTSDVADLSAACQDAQGDPFKLANPSRNDLYKAPVMSKYDPNKGTQVNPLCLFSLPVLDINDNTLGEWCRANQGVYTKRWVFDPEKRLHDYFKASDKVCGEFSDWASLGDSKICGMGVDGWQDAGIRPGCKARTQKWEMLE